MNTERKKDISILVFRQKIKHTTWVEFPPTHSVWHGDVDMAVAIAYIVWQPPALLFPKPTHCRQDHLGAQQRVFFHVIRSHSDRAVRAMEVVARGTTNAEERSICVLVESVPIRLPRQRMRLGRPKVRDLALTMREET
jgi:hypothetical protein